MPRSRTEAMLSGACVVSTYNQDAEMFLKDGENSFKALRNPKYVCDLIEGLISNYSKAVEIGQAGKKTAIELFSKERYEQEWVEVLQEVTGKKK
jgi:spore maturation protein CgeB